MTQQTAQQKFCVGKIGYLNILPIYYPLESGAVSNNLEFFPGPPAKLNAAMAAGKLDVSSMSSIEYARRPQRYYLLPDLGIGSRGPVQSVLLLSKIPIADLGGRSVLVTSESHTSATLLRILFAFYLPLRVRYVTAQRPDVLSQGDNPSAVLAIGDEALSLRGHADFPYCWDLGEVWRKWTGLPFVFGLWGARREYIEAQPGKVEGPEGPCRKLLAGKRWGATHMDEIVREACRSGLLDAAGMRSYFEGLVFDLGPEEQQGLKTFYQYLVELGEISAVPELRFLSVKRPDAADMPGAHEETGS